MGESSQTAAKYRDPSFKSCVNILAGFKPKLASGILQEFQAESNPLQPAAFQLPETILGLACGKPRRN